MTFTVCLADQYYEIDCLYGSTARFLKDYTVPGDPCPEAAAPGSGEAPAPRETARNAARIVITAEDIEAERAASALEDKLEGKAERQFSDGYLETLAVYRKIAEDGIGRGIFLFHGSCLAVDGEAYMFAAPSGTGKSTHARLWRELLGDRVVTVNDDKPLLRVTEDRVFVYGTPWDGKHRLSTNVRVPLRAVCLLRRGAENEIRKIGYDEAFPELFRQIYRPEGAEAMSRTLSLLDRLAEKTDLYVMDCNMDISAAELSYRTMRPGRE